MTDTSPRTFSSDFKQFFIRGLVVLLPTVLTLWIVVKAYQFIDDTIAEPINRGIRWVMIQGTPYWWVLHSEFEPTEEEVIAEVARRGTEARRRPVDPVQVRLALRRQNVEEWWSEWWLGALDLIGIVVAIVAVYFVGRLLGGMIGRRIYRRLESAIVSLPIFKQVYPHVKQVVDFLFGQERKFEHSRVVVVEYPRKGVWSIGLLTGEAMRVIEHLTGNESVTIFIPSSPTPFTGYTISVPRKDVIDLPISIDEALRFTISGGVLMPRHQALPAGGDPRALSQSEAEAEEETGLYPIPDEDENNDSDRPRQSPDGGNRPPGPAT